MARQFAAQRELPQAEFISAEDFKRMRGPHETCFVGNYGGPAEESVRKQIESIEEFVASRRPEPET